MAESSHLISAGSRNGDASVDASNLRAVSEPLRHPTTAGGHCLIALRGLVRHERNSAIRSYSTWQVREHRNSDIGPTLEIY